MVSAPGAEVEVALQGWPLAGQLVDGEVPRGGRAHPQVLGQVKEGAGVVAMQAIKMQLPGLSCYFWCHCMEAR